MNLKEKIKAEIERHIKEVKEAKNRFHPNLGFFDAKLSGIYDVLSILDTLEEPKYKSNPLFDKCVENCDPEVVAEVNRNVDKMLEEPVCEELENASNEYASHIQITDTKKVCGADEWLYLFTDLIDAFIAGANWQKEQNRPKSDEDLVDYAYRRYPICNRRIETTKDANEDLRDGFLEGVDWQKEQMEKNIKLIQDSWYKQGVIDGKFEGLTDDGKYQQGRFDMKEQMMRGNDKDELQKAASLYASPMGKNDPEHLEEYPVYKSSYDAFLAGAFWKEKQDKDKYYKSFTFEEYKKLTTKLYEGGMKDAKEQMMKDYIPKETAKKIARGSLGVQDFIRKIDKYEEDKQ
jgi:hypothetical protein